MTDTWNRGALFHDDPDNLVALKLGYHDYNTYDDMRNAYLNGDICELEFEAILEGCFERANKHELRTWGR